MFADFDARSVRGNGVERTANLGRRQRLEVVSLQMAWTAMYKQQQHGPFGMTRAGQGLAAQEVRQTHPTEGQQSGPQRFPP